MPDTPPGVGRWSGHPAPPLAPAWSRPVTAGEAGRRLRKSRVGDLVDARLPGVAWRTLNTGQASTGVPSGPRAREDIPPRPSLQGSDRHDASCAASNNETQRRTRATHNGPKAWATCGGSRSEHSRDREARAMSRTRAPSMRGGRRTTASHQSRARRLPAPFASATRIPRNSWQSAARLPANHHGSHAGARATTRLAANTSTVVRKRSCQATPAPGPPRSGSLPTHASGHLPKSPCDTAGKSELGQAKYLQNDNVLLPRGPETRVT
jgi:hypothetical protein